VLVAKNGKPAMEVVPEQRVDLVVTGLVIPEMEGPETIVALRTSRPWLPVVATQERSTGIF
jgi:CheY-like chemotaxis protein